MKLSPMMAGGSPNMAFPAIADGFFVMSIGRRSEFRIRVNETMPKKNVPEVLLDVLVEAGVERIYGVAGDSLNGITRFASANRFHKFAAAV